MIYIAALIFGVAVWMSNPIAAGGLTVLGFLVTVDWIDTRICIIIKNQNDIWTKLNQK